ncbi:MAG: zinc-binding alcohol dehydrogenase [Clostridia bacterium]|nr:zinc-binding alcohol dehydrogenase [Clostridia bacterium]
MKRNQILFTDVAKAELLVCETADMAADEVLVKTEYSAISAGTERANLMGMQNVMGGETFPRALGYCSVGIIVDAGKDIKNYKAGDRVLVYHGVHADYNKVKENKLTLVPDGVDPKDAALVIIAAMGLGGVRKLNIELGESAMIIGLGLLGMFAVEFARLEGAYPLIVSDLSPERRALALELGADYALDPADPDYINKVKEITGGKGVNAIVEVTGASVALEQALKFVSYMGRISLLGCTRVSECQIDYYSEVHRPGVKLIGAHNMVRPSTDSFPGYWTMHDDCAAILNLIKGGRVKIDPIISNIITPHDAPEIFNRLAYDRNFPLGVLFDWSKL